MNRHVPPSEQAKAVPVATGRLSIANRDPKAAQAHIKAARRHSRRVRFLRVALPLGVVIGVGLATAIAYFDPLKLAVTLPFDLGRVSLSGSRIMMELPKLSGFTDDNRGYSVTAKSATQDLTQPNQIDLHEIEAKLELAEKGWANLTALTGHYNTKTQQMTLSDGIKFDTSAGYGGSLSEVDINIKTGMMVSNQPVELRYLDGKLTADHMEISQKDSRALLTGRVQLVFRMPQPDDKKPAPKPAPSPAAPAAPGTAPATP